MLRPGRLSVIFAIILVLFSLARLVHPLAVGVAPSDSLSLDRREEPTYVQLNCAGETPSQIYFPREWSRRQFASLYEVCNREHSGCHCGGDDRMQLMCNGTALNYPRLNRAFRSLCENQCRCIRVHEDTATAAAAVQAPPSPYPLSGERAAANGFRGPPLNFGHCSASPCWSVQSCVSGGGLGCECVTANTPAAPGSPYMRYSTTCVQGLRRQGLHGFRARSPETTTSANATAAGGHPSIPPQLDDRACPCNCTYVSRSCCSAEARERKGVVHEAPHLQLGRVDPPDHMCCNATSGALQALPLGERRHASITACAEAGV